MSKQAYMIVTAENLGDITNNVNRMTNRGWQVQGGISVIVLPAPRGTTLLSDKQYTQALILP